MIWYTVSFINFYAGNLLFYLILKLLPTPRLKLRFTLTLILYLAFLPMMTLYTFYGSFYIKAPDNQKAKATNSHCYNIVWTKITWRYFWWCAYAKVLWCGSSSWDCNGELDTWKGLCQRSPLSLLLTLLGKLCSISLISRDWSAELKRRKLRNESRDTSKVLAQSKAFSLRRIMDCKITMMRR